MSDPNYMRNEVSELTRKIQKQLKELLGMYKNFHDEIETRFREELREQEGELAGLEDFYGLSLSIKRNTQNVGNALTLMSRLKDLSGFDISETPEKSVEKQIKELVKETK
jgi:hypothetical protein